MMQPLRHPAGLDPADVDRAGQRPGVLDVVGLGIALPADLTLGTLGVLCTASTVYCLEPEESYVQALAGWDIPFHSLQALFDRHERREDALEAGVRIAVAAATARPGIVLALGGHPTTAVLPMAMLPALARDAGVSLAVRPAVGSLDRMFADLQLDPAQHGLQVVRGSSAGHLRPGLPAVIMCPGYASTIRVPDRVVESARLATCLEAAFGAEASFVLYSSVAGRVRLERLKADDVVLVGLRPHLGSLMLVGPVEMLDGEQRRGLELLLEPREKEPVHA
jgi:hypothetical protein